MLYKAQIIRALNGFPVVGSKAIDHHIRRNKPFIEETLREHRFLFVHVPKNGGTSIAESVHRRKKCSSHLPFFVLEAFARRIGVENPFSCAVVREPLDRFVSAYCYNWRFQGLGEAGVPLEKHLASINDFVSKDLTARVLNTDYVYFPQTWFLRGSRPIDRLIPFDAIGPGHQKLRESFSFIAGLPHRNASRREPPSSLLSSDSIARLEAIYADDLILYHEAAAAVDEPA